MCIGELMSFKDVRKKSLNVKTDLVSREAVSVTEKRIVMIEVTNSTAQVFLISNKQFIFLLNNY